MTHLSHNVAMRITPRGVCISSSNSRKFYALCISHSLLQTSLGVSRCPAMWITSRGVCLSPSNSWEHVCALCARISYAVHHHTNMLVFSFANSLSKGRWLILHEIVCTVTQRKRNLIEFTRQSWKLLPFVICNVLFAKCFRWRYTRQKYKQRHKQRQRQTFG